jgi:hypothetical protein
MLTKIQVPPEFEKRKRKKHTAFGGKYLYYY